MTTQESSPIKFAFGKGGLLPQEEMLEVIKSNKKLVIGIPKEAEKIETRVCLTPEAVELLVNYGHEVIIESNAGKVANYSNHDYSERGGIILEDKKSVYHADVVLKVSTPSSEEIDLLKGQQVLISSLLSIHQTEECVRKLMAKKITAVAAENYKDDNDCYPVVRSMSAISGTASILIASEYLSTGMGGKGVLLGGIAGITPAEVVIIGASTAAEFAIRAAYGLGAFVKVFDNSVHSLVQLQISLGFKIYTSVFHPQVLGKALKSADVVIGARQTMEKGPRFYITEEMVKGMKKGSVIVDISIPHGGCIETSEYRTLQDPVFTKYGVVHYSIPNLPSHVARTSSIALSNVFLPLLLNISDAGGFIQQLKRDPGLRHGVYMFNGILTNQFIGSHFGIPSKDIELLMAAF
jgi:alanine dehydrogenase